MHNLNVNAPTATFGLEGTLSFGFPTTQVDWNPILDNSEDHIQASIRNSPFEPLANFDKAKFLYISNLIYLLRSQGFDIASPSFSADNLEWFGMASEYLIKSGKKCHKTLSSENKGLIDFLDDNLFVEMQPEEEFEIKAKIVFEEGQPDLSGLEEF